MKVLYDLDGFRHQFGGVARCTVENIVNLPHNVDYELAISVSKNAYLLQSALGSNISDKFVDKSNFLSGINVRGKDRLFDLLESAFRKFPSYTNVNKPISIEAFKRQDFDVFHCPSTDCDTYFLKYLQSKPFVLTVHDMISEMYDNPDNRQSKIKRQLVPLAAHIVAVSENTKKDLIRLLHVPESKITVIYHGSPTSDSYRQFDDLKMPYFLYVGNRHAYKNFIQTLKDFSDFHKNHTDVSLVCVGGGDFNKTEKRALNEMNISGNVMHFSASEEQLYNFYRNAIAFIFPSLYEGFGIPILESFSYGCPALLNDSSCFPEIAGDAALFFHSRPDQGISNLKELMEIVYNMSSEERKSILRRGYDRASGFTWQKSAQQLANVFRCVCRNQ